MEMEADLRRFSMLGGKAYTLLVTSEISVGKLGKEDGGSMRVFEWPVLIIWYAQLRDTMLLGFTG